MKKILLSSLIAAAAAVPAIAGINNINYQAVIKDGNVALNDQKVTLKFELLDKEGVVYTEQQTPTTTSTGYVSCKLGENADLSTLNWGDLTLKVSVDLGSGFEVISEGAVSSVPTALYALRTADTDALREEVDAFATMNETRLDKIQTQVDGIDSNFANLGENLDNLYIEMDTRFAQVDGQLENLNNVAAVARANEEAVEGLNEQIDAFATMNETRIDKLQKQADTTDADLENIKENLTMTLTEVNTRLDDADGKIESLQNFATTVKEEYATNEAVEAFSELLQANLDKIQKQADTTDADLENIKENLTNAFEAKDAEIAEINGQLENLQNFATVVKEEYATNEAVEAFSELLQTNLDKIQKQVDLLDPEVEGLVKDMEDVKNNVKEMGADVAQIEGLAQKVESLEEGMAAIVSPTDPESMMNQINGAMGELGEEVEGLVKDNEEIKTNLKNISADVAQVEGLAEKVELLETSVKMITDPTDPESILNMMSERMADMEAEFMAKIADLEAQIKALKGE